MRGIKSPAGPRGRRSAQPSRSRFR